MKHAESETLYCGLCEMPVEPTHQVFYDEHGEPAALVCPSFSEFVTDGRRAVPGIEVLGNETRNADHTAQRKRKGVL